MDKLALCHSQPKDLTGMWGSKYVQVNFILKGRKTCKEGEGCNEEDVGRKVVGSNPGVGKVFSREISIK